MSEMIQRVAAALRTYAITQPSPHIPGDPKFVVYERAWGVTSKPLTGRMTKEEAGALCNIMNARAVIKVMRTSTSAMNNAGYYADRIKDAQADEIWEAMIDELLKEGA